MRIQKKGLTSVRDTRHKEKAYLHSNNGFCHGSQEYDITLLQCIRMTYGLAVQGGNGNNGDLQLKQHTEHYESNLIPPMSHA